MNPFRASLLFVCLLATTVSAQNYVYPGKTTPAPCTGCGGSNEGLPTYPYNDLLVAHAGRFVDSTSVPNVQNAGMRTVRARATRVAKDRNRIYVQLGEAIGAYSLDQFFTTTLRKPMVSVKTLPFTPIASWSRPGGLYETVAMPESLFYSESRESGWTTPLIDQQVILYGFDIDDRGYVYIAEGNFGWGVARDTGARHMEFVTQQTYPIATNIISLRVGSSYYAVLYAGLDPVRVYDVTNPATPLHVSRTFISGEQFATTYSIDRTRQRVALANFSNDFRIYDLATWIVGGAPLASFPHPAGKVVRDLAFDESGTLWVALCSTSGFSTNTLMKLTPTENGYTMESFDIYGAAFEPRRLSVGAGFLAITGYATESDKSLNRQELRLFRLVNGTPQFLATDQFFHRYYEVAPEGYADPGAYTGTRHIHILEQDAKTYLIYSAEGLGDAYVLDRGTTPQISTSISLTSSSLFSSPGDTVTLTARVTPQSIGAAPPVGVVTFTKNGVALATVPLVASTNNTYVATLERTDLGSGVHTLTASFEGDDLYQPSGPATYTQHGLLPAPSGVNATASGSSSVVITWQALQGATAYRVLRSPNVNTPFTQIAQVPGTTSTDLGVNANTTYLYRVVGIDGTREGTASATEIATTVAFTDNPLAAGMTIRLAHLTQLRTAVNALRAAAALDPATFTDPAPALRSIVKAAHVTELRTAADQARAALGLGSVAISPITAQVTNIRRLDFDALRQAVQ